MFGGDSIDLAQLEAGPHVWLLPIDGEPDPGWLDEQATMLSAEETERWLRYRRPSDRNLFLAAHVLVRSTLSRYADWAPPEWVFETNQYGRPEIVGGPAGLRFNLSHTEGMIALMIHEFADAGVDVERIGRVDDLESVARTSFSESERAGFLALEEDERPGRFYALWTLKEAYIKARGMGLAIPLDSFSFDLADPDRIGLSGREDLGDDTDGWSFTTRMCSPTHVLSTAQRVPTGCSKQSPLCRVL